MKSLKLLQEFDMAAIRNLAAGFDGVMVCDQEAVIQYCSPYYLNILKLTAVELIGLPIEEILPRARTREVINNKKPIMAEIWEMHRQSVAVSSYPISANGVIIGVLILRLLDDRREADKLIRNLQKAFPDAVNPQPDQGINGAKYTLATIIGESEGIIEAKERVKMIADSNVPVLIQGDTGTGKELIAHALHQESSRRSEPFIRVNCAGIPENLLESELFGYDEGAFTGARRGGKPGKFELANQGSIFLDEISELSLAAQAKLLRTLQENEIERVGSTRIIPIHARVISATNQPLTRLVEEGKFRKDLMFRLAVFSIYIPPLKERTEDIPLLCRHFIDNYNREHDTNITGLTKEGLEFLVDYHWPGNVRELYITIERACLDAQGGMLTINNILRYLGVAEGQYLKDYSYVGFDLRQARQQAEKVMIQRALLASEGNRQQAARLLGISRSALYNKLDELGIKE